MIHSISRFPNARGACRSQLLQQDNVFGGDFDYGRLNAFAITYVPIGDKVVLGIRVDGGLITGGQRPAMICPA